MSTSPYAQVVMNEIVALAGDPSLTMEELGRNMEQLSDHAQSIGDQNAMALVDVAWNGILTLSEQAGQAFNVAIAAKAVAEQLQAQRDLAVQEHGELVKAIREWDYENEEIAQLVEGVEEMVYENLQFETYVSCDPGEDICEIAVIPVAWEIASDFHEVLTGQPYDDILPEALRQELGQFMTQFMQKVKTAMKRVNGE